jgi:glycerol-3-phosphate dehydrogenase
MTRAESFDSLGAEPFDVLVIGGGATGLGIAVDAVTRGFRTALVEGGDFAQATSSRATKLVHGGVRYLASGQVHLVYEALHERAVMMRNAPHLVHPQPFLLPTYKWIDLPFYGAGLLLYDLMSGKSTMGPTSVLSSKAAVEQIPNLNGEGLTGGVLYHDGQFNDARLALELARTAADHGATVLNYARCMRLVQEGGKNTGAVVVDMETSSETTVRAKVVFNAAGIFVDEVRDLDDSQAKPLMTVSRGTHIVVGPEALAGDAGASAGMMVPKTADGRVIFAIPWQGKVVIGTTDVAAPRAEMEPGHTQDEIGFLLETIQPYLAKPVGESDILSVFSGLRPLVTGSATSTSKLSREHYIEASAHGLITVAGGKWTTYRRMAEDAVDFAMKMGVIEKRACVSADVPLHGAAVGVDGGSVDDPYLREYGADVASVRRLAEGDPVLANRIDPALAYTFAQVVYAVRQEMARTVEDVLSRRTRALLLDSQAAGRAALAVAMTMAAELGRDQSWIDSQVRQFQALVKNDYSRQQNVRADTL